MHQVHAIMQVQVCPRTGPHCKKEKKRTSDHTEQVEGAKEYESCWAGHSHESFRKYHPVVDNKKLYHEHTAGWHVIEVDCPISTLSKGHFRQNFKLHAVFVLADFATKECYTKCCIYIDDTKHQLHIKQTADGFENQASVEQISHASHCRQANLAQANCSGKHRQESLIENLDVLNGYYHIYEP